MRREDCDELPGACEREHDVDIYADVDSDAKRAAMDKVADSFDMDLAAFSTSAAHRSAERRRAQLLGGPAQGDARRHR